MEGIMYELAAFAGIIIITYLISPRFSWFSRSEVSRDVKPEKIESEDNVKSFFRFANRESEGDYRIVITHSNEAVRVEKRRQKKLRFETEEAFIKAEHSEALGQAAKIIGFIEWRENPAILVQVFRVITGLLIQLTVLAALFAGFMMIIPVFVNDLSQREVLPTLFLLSLAVVSGNIILTIKEFFVYIWQNRYSMKILRDFGVGEAIEKSVTRYLWKSMLCYIGISIIKIAVMIGVLIIFAVYLPV